MLTATLPDQTYIVLEHLTNLLISGVNNSEGIGFCQYEFCAGVFWGGAYLPYLRSRF
jgi:hypothetical protein